MEKETAKENMSLRAVGGITDIGKTGEKMVGGAITMPTVINMLDIFAMKKRVALEPIPGKTEAFIKEDLQTTLSMVKRNEHMSTVTFMMVTLKMA